MLEILSMVAIFIQKSKTCRVEMTGFKSEKTKQGEIATYKTPCILLDAFFLLKLHS